MPVAVLEPPEPFLDLDVVKTHLRVEGSGEDALIEAYIAAVCAHLDGVDGWLGRAIGDQLLELRLTGFCRSEISLPYRPVQEVAAIDYTDAAGAEQVVPLEDYWLDGHIVRLAGGKAWPSTGTEANPVRLQYRAGYVEPPKAIIVAALMLVGDLYANRETATVGGGAVALNMGASAEKLLSPFRVWDV